ncbi:MAG: A24 family peptidase [Methylococcales bacterium]
MFLFIAVVCDLRWRRIPNKLVVICLATGLSMRGFELGWAGLGTATLGSLTGLLVLLPFYIAAALGAGDVKFMAAVGSFLEPSQVLLAAVLGIALNGAVGLLIIILAGDLFKTVHRYMAMLTTFLSLNKPHYIEPTPDEAAGRKMPYVIGLSIAVATVALYPDLFSMVFW